MTTDHAENNEPREGPEEPIAEKNEPGGAACPAGHSHNAPPSPQSDESCKAVKRAETGGLAQLQASELYKHRFSASEQMRKLLANTTAAQIRTSLDTSTVEQMYGFMGNSIVKQMQNLARGSLGEQMRQIKQAVSPLHTIQNTLGHLARNAAISSVHQFLGDQAYKHHQRMTLIRPTWEQTHIGSAFSDSFRAAQSLGAIHQAEVLHSQNAFRQLSSIANLIESLRPKLPSFDQLSEFWLRYPARVKENLIALAAAGWYLDPEMSVTDVVHFKDELENNTVEEVNEGLAGHFQSSLDRIEASLCEDHPHRAHLIKEAFEAHREGKYSLSIPALFAQADGICLDLTGHQIFTGNGLARFAKRIDPETLERAYLEPLLRTMPITESSRKRRAEIPQLNRHAVMHGESTDFPSEANGLKAVSFIHFVSHVLGMAATWKDDAQALPEVEEPIDLNGHSSGPSGGT